MKLTSKIKTIFSDETLEILAKMCDTMRIPSVIKKMELAQQIIKRQHPDVEFSILGGATNRLVLFIDGMPIKLAMDSQGYKDNLQEYALGPELQPYVPKPFETNGYILVCEPWRALTSEEFHLRKIEILKILELLAQDYLLGDVGYIERNYTNWGVNDNGDIGILDYAYVHRATENLFTCEVCGQGILRYDSSYSRLKCSNATVCNATYRYLDRKIWQGYKVDQDMIDEMLESSLIIKRGKTFIDVTDNDGLLVKGNKKIISTRDQYLQYVQEARNMENFDTKSALDLLIDQVEATTEDERKKINNELNDLVIESEDCDDEDVEVVVDYDPFEEEEIEEEEEYEECDDEYIADVELAMSISDLIDTISGPITTPMAEIIENIDTSVGGVGKDNKFVLNSENVEVNVDGTQYHQGVTLEPNNKLSKNKDNVNNQQIDEQVTNDIVEDMAKEFKQKVDNIVESATVEVKSESVVVSESNEGIKSDDNKKVIESDKQQSIISTDYKGIVINNVPLNNKRVCESK